MSLIELSFIDNITGTIPKPLHQLPHIIRKPNSTKKMELFARFLSYDENDNIAMTRIDTNELSFHMDLPINCKLLYEHKKKKQPLVLHNVDGFLYGKNDNKIQFVSMWIRNNFDNKQIIIKITDSLYPQFFIEVKIPMRQMKLWTRKWTQMSLLSDVPC
jgi:hypothetical protein